MSASTPADADHADAGDGDDDDAPGAKGEKKKKNSYKHLIKGIPGMCRSFSRLLSLLFSHFLRPSFYPRVPRFIFDSSDLFR